MKKTTGKKKDECAINFVHKDRVDSAKKAIQHHDTIHDLTETFQILSDPTRLKICMALAKEELCVCDIAALLAISESAVSHQLRLLRNLRLVQFRRDGKMAYYFLDDEHIEDLIRIATRHVTEP